MDSYVVRISRRAGRMSRTLIGTIEVAGTEEKVGFSNIEELWEILKCRKHQREPEMPHQPKSERTANPAQMKSIQRYLAKAVRR